MSPGLGSKASASAPAGTMLPAPPRSPPTAAARLCRSGVVATIASSAAAGDKSASAAANAMTGAATACAVRHPIMARTIVLFAGHPEALGHQARDLLFRCLRRQQAAIHRHAGERIGIEARQ